MTYFRHGPLTFWTVILAALLLLAGLGLAVMRDGTNVTDTIVAPDTHPTADVDMLVTTLSSLYPSMNAGMGTTWAKDFEELALAGQERYLKSQSSNELKRQWQDVATAAHELTLTDPADKEKFVANAGLLGAAVGRLNEAAHRN